MWQESLTVEIGPEPPWRGHKITLSKTGWMMNYKWYWAKRTLTHFKFLFQHFCGDWGRLETLVSGSRMKARNFSIPWLSVVTFRYIWPCCVERVRPARGWYMTPHAAYSLNNTSVPFVSQTVQWRSSNCWGYVDSNEIFNHSYEVGLKSSWKPGRRQGWSLFSDTLLWMTPIIGA
jgi:hypothetical protein